MILQTNAKTGPRSFDVTRDQARVGATIDHLKTRVIDGLHALLEDKPLTTLAVALAVGYAAGRWIKQ